MPIASLSGKIALVAGPSAPFGDAVARLLAARGAAVVLLPGPDAAGAHATLGAIAATGADADCIEATSDAPGAVLEAIERAHARWGRLDVLVCLPAPAPEGALLTLAPDVWEGAFRREVQGTFQLIQAASRFMLLERRGRIVNVLPSLATPSRGQALAAACVGALGAMTRAIAVELAPRQIVVNAVAPGAGAAAVAEAVAFLAGEEAAYMAGETLHVGGPAA